MSWIAVGTTVLAAGSSYMSSKATKKQAQIQAKSIKEGGAIDQAARNRAISQVLEIFGPSLSQFNESMQSSIDLYNQGRVSTGDLLTNSAQNVSQIAQQGGQQALSALLGIPSPATDQSAQPQAFDGTATQPLTTDQTVAPTQGEQPVHTEQSTQGIGQQQLFQQPDGTVRPGGQMGFDVPVGSPSGIDIPRDPDGAFNPKFNTAREAVPAAFQREQDPVFQREQDPVFQQQTPLEGEFIPRDYDFQQQQLTMPQGTGAGLFGAEQAITGGAELGRESLGSGAIGALESLGTQTGIARGDIEGGRNFALNQIQQAIQSGRSGTQAGVGSIEQGVNRAVDFLNPYMSAGQEALNPYLALSGARGQSAFDEARLNDPAYNLALQESERALGRQAAVTGGIGSGNTKGRFQLNAQQQAAADIDRQLGRLRHITGAGQQAAGQAGGFTSQGGMAAGQMQQRGGELESSLLSRMGDVGIQSSQQLSSLAQQLGMSEAQVLQTLGSNLSNIDVSTGRAIGGVRETAGINAANILQETTGQQMGIEQGLAQQLGNLDQETLNNIVNSMQTGAGTTLQSQQQLATLLANLGIGAGSSAQQTAINVGQAQAAGVTNPIGNAIDTGIGLYSSGAFNQPANQPTPYAQTDTSNMNLNLSQIPQMFSPGQTPGISTPTQQNRVGTTYNPPITSVMGPTINDPAYLYS